MLVFDESRCATGEDRCEVLRVWNSLHSAPPANEHCKIGYLPFQAARLTHERLGCKSNGGKSKIGGGLVRSLRSVTM